MKKIFIPAFIVVALVLLAGFGLFEDVFKAGVAITVVIASMALILIGMLYFGIKRLLKIYTWEIDLEMNRP